MCLLMSFMSLLTAQKQCCSMFDRYGSILQLKLLKKIKIYLKVQHSQLFLGDQEKKSHQFVLFITLLLQKKIQLFILRRKSTNPSNHKRCLTHRSIKILPCSGIENCDLFPSFQQTRWHWICINPSVEMGAAPDLLLSHLPKTLKYKDKGFNNRSPEKGDLEESSTL